ncbi:hypothetical protein [Neorhizobium alkalisoli]|uniref:hypothetical protein n=1 Tax=Neorhizobium alkalisoli TaxID=528178 RepID=UPI00119EB252|nr:hypothetical protein [Neorhizobium alkalisoli]
MLKITTIIATIACSDCAYGCDVTLIDAKRFENSTIREINLALQRESVNISILPIEQNISPARAAGLVPPSTQVVVVHFSTFATKTLPDNNGDFGTFIKEAQKITEAHAKYVVYSRAFSRGDSCDSSPVRDTVLREANIDEPAAANICFIHSAPPRFVSKEQKESLKKLILQRCY